MATLSSHGCKVSESYVFHDKKMFPSLFPQWCGSAWNSREGLSPNRWKIAPLFCVGSCDSGSKLTTDLGVGGSNPSGRATFQVLTKQDYRQCVQNVSTARIPNDRRKATGVENG